MVSAPEFEGAAAAVSAEAAAAVVDAVLPELPPQPARDIAVVIASASAKTFFFIM